VNHKQAAKRRWKANRDKRAAWHRTRRREYRENTVRVKTLFGTLHIRTHPLFRSTTNTPGELPTVPGFYDLTKP